METAITVISRNGCFFRFAKTNDKKRKRIRKRYYVFLARDLNSRNPRKTYIVKYLAGAPQIVNDVFLFAQNGVAYANDGLLRNVMRGLPHYVPQDGHIIAEGAIIKKAYCNLQYAFFLDGLTDRTLLHIRLHTTIPYALFLIFQIAVSYGSNHLQ